MKSQMSSKSQHTNLITSLLNRTKRKLSNGQSKKISSRSSSREKLKSDAGDQKKPRGRIVAPLTMDENEDQVEELRKRLAQMTKKCKELQEIVETDKVLAEFQGRAREVKVLKDENTRLEKLVTTKSHEVETARSKLVTANKDKASLSAQITEYEMRVNKLEQCLLLPLSARIQYREELQVVKEAIQSIRFCFSRNDPHQHTIDTVEESLSTLLERLCALESFQFSVEERIENPENEHFSCTLDRKRCSRLHLSTPYLYPYRRTVNSQKLSSSQIDLRNPDSSEGCTKVLYFTERAVTPYLSVIPKRLGEITLRDFKIIFDRPGQYRFHFKTLDPEFGMVKEEILFDDDILPGWDGKIIAWVDEDNG